jgi:hypothetical protein
LFPYEETRPDMSRLHWATHAPVLGPEFIKSCEAWRLSVKKPALIIVDVLQRIKPAGSAARNSYENDYSALADLQQWATESGVSVLVLHHTHKGGADDPLEALSGSNGLSACADTTLVLDRTAAGITLYVRGRDVEEKETALRFDVGRWTVLGEAADIRRSDERTRILVTLKEAIEPMSPAEIADAIGTPRNNAKQFLFQMAKTGEVRKIARGRYIHPDRRDLDPDANQITAPITGQTTTSRVYALLDELPITRITALTEDQKSHQNRHIPLGEAVIVSFPDDNQLTETRTSTLDSSRPVIAVSGVSKSADLSSVATCPSYVTDAFGFRICGKPTEPGEARCAEHTAH